MIIAVIAVIILLIVIIIIIIIVVRKRKRKNASSRLDSNYVELTARSKKGQDQHVYRGLEKSRDQSANNYESPREKSNKDPMEGKGNEAEGDDVYDELKECGDDGKEEKVYENPDKLKEVDYDVVKGSNGIYEDVSNGKMGEAYDEIQI